MNVFIGIIRPSFFMSLCGKEKEVSAFFNCKEKRNVETFWSFPVVGHEIVDRERVGAEESDVLKLLSLQSPFSI